MCRLKCKIGLACIFGELSAARKFGRLVSVFYNFSSETYSKSTQYRYKRFDLLNTGACHACSSNASMLK